MNNKIKLWGLSLFLFGLSSCAESDYTGVSSDRVAVTFAPQIEGSVTRAVDQTWSADDQVGICMVADGAATDAGSVYSRYRVSGEGISVGLMPVTVDQTLFYPTDGSDVNFVAFSPYATVESNVVTYGTFADQSTQANMEKVDLLYHKGTTAYNKTSGSAALAFSHQLSKIIVRVTTSGDANAVTLSSLNMAITGTPGSVSANLADGSITAGGENATIAPFHTSPDADTRVATAIVVPHAATGGRSITFAGEEGNFTYNLPAGDFEFESNKVYTLNFKVTHQGVTLSDASIDVWTGGDSDWDKDFALHVEQPAFTFDPVDVGTTSFGFKSNYGGTFAVKLSTSKDDMNAGTPDWITPGSVSKTGEAYYTSYTYSYTVADNDDESNRANRTAYAHITTGDDSSVAVVTINQDGLYSVPSNSYILTPDGTSIFIPVSRANEHKAGAIGSADVLTAEFLWSDAAGLLTKCEAMGVGSGGCIKVTSNADAKMGNAVVAVKVNDEIKWSWHIWVTDYVPTPIGTKGFMDRNLGATSATKSATMSERIKTFGLYYQWGRKDPFPGSAGDAAYTGVEPTIYSGIDDITGAQYAINDHKVTAQQAYDWSVGNPTTFVGFSGSWWNVPEPATSDNQWGATGGKTIYDPCPPGYRVPASGSWGAADSAWSSFTWDATYLGRDTGVTYGGWYPVTGRRLSTTGALNNVGTNGFCWSATPSSAANGYSLQFSNSSVMPTSSNSRTNGLSIRCCQD